MADDEVADVRDPGEQVGEDEHGVTAVKPVGQQAARSAQAQPPKGIRHDHAFVLLRGPPLHEKSRREQDVSHPPNDFPEVPLDAEKLSTRRERICEPIHIAVSKAATVRERQDASVGANGGAFLDHGSKGRLCSQNHCAQYYHDPRSTLIRRFKQASRNTHCCFRMARLKASLAKRTKQLAVRGKVRDVPDVA